jgi:hypothetical protein
MMQNPLMGESEIRLIARNWANTGLFDTLAKKYTDTFDDRTSVSREVALMLAEKGVIDDRIREILRKAQVEEANAP